MVTKCGRGQTTNNINTGGALYSIYIMTNKLRVSYVGGHSKCLCGPYSPIAVTPQCPQSSFYHIWSVTPLDLDTAHAQWETGLSGGHFICNKGVVRMSVQYSLVTPVATEGYPATHLYVPPLKHLAKGGNIWRSHSPQKSAEDSSGATVSTFVYCILTKCPVESFRLFT